MDAEPVAERAGGSVRLMPMARGDGGLYRRLYTDAEVMRHVGGPLSAVAAAAAFEVACRQVAVAPPRAWYWCIHRVAAGDDAPAVGLVAVVLDAPARCAPATSAELGVLLAPSAQGLGLATQTIVLAASAVFDLTPLQRLWTRHAAAHAAACGLMRTLGFQPADIGGAQRRWELRRSRWALDRGLGCAARGHRG